MEIIIAGAGSVGFNLAKTLSVEHNIVLIDKNKETLNRISESLDIMPLYGHVENPEVYQNLLDKHYDIFIAVTNSDEANLFATLMADDILNVNKKIIRLHNTYFSKSSIAERLGIDEVIFPYTTTAQSVKLLLDFPKANNVKNFRFLPHKLISIYVKQSTIHSVKEINSQQQVVVGIERDKSFFVPNDEELLEEGDLIYLFGSDENICSLSQELNQKSPQKISKIAIFGANTLGVEIAKVFLETKSDVKIVEKDETLCREATEILKNRATIIHSRYIADTIYNEENVKHADLIISTSRSDEENIIRCLEAKEYNIPKTIAINNDTNFYDLMHKLGIVTIRGPKTMTYYGILERIFSNETIRERHYCGARGSIFMRKVTFVSQKETIPIEEQESRLFLVRGGAIVPFNEPQLLNVGDIIILFTPTNGAQKVKNWMQTL